MKIYRIGELPLELYETVGGKARGLDFLVRHNFKIARGFILSEIESLSENDIKKIYEYFDELEAKTVSVRSSASNEDGSLYSNAGQYETYLFVKKEELLAAIKKCIASVNSVRAKAYNEKFLNETDSKMNIVIEKMVDSKVAGVYFSSDPQNIDNVLIEAVKGQGENLVSGASSSSHYSIPKAGFKVQDTEILTTEELEEIYKQGLAIQKSYEDEVDLEWAIGSNNKLYWLQLRPITTLGASSVEEFNSPNDLSKDMLTTRNIGEMMPGAITPLTISTSVYALDYGIRNMFKKAGAVRRIEKIPVYSAALVYDYHLFLDMSTIHTLGLKIGIASPDQMNLSILGEFDIEYPPLRGKRANGLARLIHSVSFIRYIFSHNKAKKKAVKIESKLSFEKKDKIEDIYRQIDAKLHAINDVLALHYVCSSYSGMMNSTLYMTFNADFASKEEYQDFVASILEDIDGIESADILASLTIMARHIKAHYPAAASYDEKGLLELVKSNKDTKLTSLYNDFLAKHGHRSIKEAEMRSLSWKHDELSLMKNLHVVLTSLKDQEEAKEPFDLDKIANRFKGAKKKVIKFVGKNARQGVRDREFSKSLIIKVIDKFKDQYRLLATKLVEAKLLFDEDSIYFLTHQEIGELIKGNKLLKRKALSRKLAYEEASELSFDDIVIGNPKPIEVNSLDAKSTLKGIPVCRGKVYGKAHIIRKPEDALELKKGDIMVAPFTDIGWSPYYSIVSALITEVGSSLSHGAVVAREYNLPTIVNVKNATKLLKDGDYLYIDASKGVVNVISEEEYLKEVALP